MDASRFLKTTSFPDGLLSPASNNDTKSEETKTALLHSSLGGVPLQRWKSRGASGPASAPEVVG
jgi:hypothetical protein